MKKACVIHVVGEGNPAKLVGELEQQGYSVEIIELEADDFRRLRVCDPIDLPHDVQEKISHADLVVFYLTETPCENEGFDGLAQCAAGAGADIVGVWPEGSTCGVFPETLKNLGQAAISEADVKLPEVLCGEKDVWVLPDGSSGTTSDEMRQSKC